jgi:hypothetical protein
MSTPTRYNSKLVLLICERIATTPQSLAKICQAEDMPSIATLFRWLRDHPDFNELYSKAKVVQAELLIEEALDLVDDSSNDLIVSSDDRLVPNLAAFKRCMIKVEYRKWLASKLLPRKYGHHLHLSAAAATTSPPPEQSPAKGRILTSELHEQLIQARERQNAARPPEPKPDLPSQNSDPQTPNSELPSTSSDQRVPIDPILLRTLDYGFTSIPAELLPPNSMPPPPPRPIRRMYDCPDPQPVRGKRTINKACS